MYTLLLRLAAPMQAWGLETAHETRTTEREPTKSGVIGLLASALGYSRDDSEKLAILNKLRIGVRTDREGKLLKDFHTAKSPAISDSYITNRYYLCDAVFLVGIEGENLEDVAAYEDALKHPAYPLFLGRRSCPPTIPLVMGIRNKPLKSALEDEPLLTENRSGVLRLTLEAEADNRNSAFKRDVPVSFSMSNTTRTYRRITESFVSKGETPDVSQQN